MRVAVDQLIWLTGRDHHDPEISLNPIMFTAFHKKITVPGVIYGFPGKQTACCNLLGALEGRSPSWPMTVRAEEGYSRENLVAALFDGIAFGRREKAPAVFTVGYSDEVAVPSSVCAVCQVYGEACNSPNFP